MSKYDDEYFNNLWDSKSTTKYSDDYFNNLWGEEEEDTEYSVVRSATVDFLESAIGAGDELDATVRLLAGEAANWNEAIEQSREELRALSEKTLMRLWLLLV